MLPAPSNTAPPREGVSQYATQGSTDIVLTYAVQPMFEDDIAPV